MALALADRVLTVAVTATLTSAAWIVVGGGLRFSSASTDASAQVVEPIRSASTAGPDKDPAGASERSPLIVPVRGVRVEQLVDTFGDDRGEGTRRHEALDIMAPAGTPVVAALGGTIEKLYASNDGGNTIYLRSPDRATIHYYAHLAGYAPGLREGQQVRQGDPLGTVGSTGNADPAAPHLHFAVLRTTPQARWWDPATAINPYVLLRGH